MLSRSLGPLLWLGCVMLAGCKGKNADAGAPPIDAYFVYPVDREVEEHEDFTGQTDAEKYVVVKARATGHLEKINFNDGDMVNGPVYAPVLPPAPARSAGLAMVASPLSGSMLAAGTLIANETFFSKPRMIKDGDVLFEIDHREYQAALDKAVAELEQDRAQLENARAQIEHAKAQLRQYEVRTARLEKEHHRGVDLVPRNAMSQEQFDKIVADLAETRSLVRQAEASKRAAEASERAAEASIKRAEASKQTAEYNLAWTKVTAGISGRISSRAVDIKNIVEKEKTVLTTIVSIDPMYAKFFIDERTVLRLRKNVKDGKLLLSQDQKMRFNIGLADETGYSIDGELDFVDNMIDSGTGTLKVRGTFDNTTYLPGTWPWERFTNQRLPVGLFIRIRLPLGEKQYRMLIPEKAIGVDQDKKFVYIINDRNEVERRAVKLGTLQEDGMRVIDDGLEKGVKVIVKGLQRVRPKMVVEPKLDTNPLGQ